MDGIMGQLAKKGCVEMEFKTKERVVSAIAVMLLVASFGALIYLDRSHGGFGSNIDAGEVATSVIKNTGHLTVPELPDDLLIFGAGTEASLDLAVENLDQDNDIDTVFVTVPDGSIDNATVSWKMPSLTHEWTFDQISGSEARFQALDDLPGRVFGGSAQYDVSGNIDDALDHSLEPLISEGIIITIDITTPQTAGAKSGVKGISLEVADLMTEVPGSPRTLVDPFPYPFLVLDEDYEFIVYELRSSSSTLEIAYGSSRLFTSSRASGAESSIYGFKYFTDDTEVVVLDMPEEGTLVKPIVRATKDNVTEPFVLDMFLYRTETIDSSVPTEDWLDLVASEVAYTDMVPSSVGGLFDLDIDGDLVLNKKDSDRDGDGIPNAEDTAPDDPTIANRDPVVSRVYADKPVLTEGEPLVLHVDGMDPDNDTISYSWSLVSDPGWTMSGKRIVITGLAPGSYTFNVEATDLLGGSDEGSVYIVVNEAVEGPNDNDWVVYLIIAIAVILILVAVIFFVLKDKDQEEEEPQEISPETLSEDGASEGEEGGPEADGVVPPSMENGVGEFEEDEDLDEFEEEPEPSPQAPIVPAQEDIEPEEVQDLENLIEEMDRAEDEIGDVCPECSSPLGPYDTECSKCGAQFEIALECPNCGSVVEDNAGKCPSCGVAFQ